MRVASVDAVLVLRRAGVEEGAVAGRRGEDVGQGVGAGEEGALRGQRRRRNELAVLVEAADDVGRGGRLGQVGAVEHVDQAVACEEEGGVAALEGAARWGGVDLVGEEEEGGEGGEEGA